MTKLLLSVIFFSNSVHGLRLSRGVNVFSTNVMGVTSCKEDPHLCNPDEDLIHQYPEYDTYTAAADVDVNKIPDGLRGGLAYIKVPKVGSSTWAGVMRRISSFNNLGHFRDGPNWPSKETKPGAFVWANHSPRKQIESILKNIMPNAAYVTIVRDPVERALSEFYHLEVTRGHKLNTDANKIQYLKNASPEYQSNYIQSHSGQAPEDIMKQYAFVGLTERFDESLLLLSKKFGLKTSQLLYLRSKVSGQVSTGQDDHGMMAKHIPLTAESSAVQDAANHLETGSDAALHGFINSALEKAISEYPRDAFKKDLEDFQKELHQLEGACRSRFSKSCLWNDNGCAQACIDGYVSRK